MVSGVAANLTFMDTDGDLDKSAEYPSPAAHWYGSSWSWTENTGASTPLRALLAEAVGAGVVCADADDSWSTRWHGGRPVAHRDIDSDGRWYDVKRAFWSSGEIGFGGIATDARADFIVLVLTREPDDLTALVSYQPDGRVRLEATLQPDAVYVVPTVEVHRLARRSSPRRWLIAPGDLAQHQVRCA